MNVTYEARYEEGTKPLLCKVVSTDEDSVVTSLSLNNTEEIASLSDDLIWEHMNNLIEYLNTQVGTVSLVPQGVMPDSGWPVTGWNDIARVHEEIIQWWVYVTQREETIQVIHNLAG